MSADILDSRGSGREDMFDPFKPQIGTILLENLEIINKETNRYKVSITRQYNCIYRVAQPMDAILT